MIDEFATLGLLDDEAITLDTAALQLAMLDHPAVELAPYAELLSAIGERLVAVAADSDTPASRASVLARVISGEFRFSGDRSTYDDPDNADMIRVMDRRLGLPVSLSILYVSAARRLGWTADALNTPGHVLVRIASQTESVLVDPFSDGAVLGPEALAELLSRMLGAGTQPTAEHLQPMTNRSVLVRLLMNQASRAEQGGHLRRALTLFHRMTVIAPENGHAWWDLARLQLLDGDFSAARSSLSAMLEVTRDPTVRGHVHAALDALSGASG